ncbi:Outer membrane beta-barrel assembly protein BamD [hydrothermal vent metagenome]|uniref:Outer membrane beta-barrel assembly protein BamD n=1 Tax=hydrothermal vent metagenome TaxID=652676 RepID=A0A3B0W074_9ZZZZ
MKKTLLSTLIIAMLSLQGCSTLTSLVAKEDSEKTVEEFYSSATTAFKAGMWDTAIKEYEKLKSFYPYGDYTEQSYLELAYSYYRYNEPESAIRELDEFIRQFPKHPSVDYALYLQALSVDSVNKSWLDKFLTDPANRDTRSTLRAFQYYNRLLEQFPNSRYAPEASKRLIALRNQMARHELLVAQFYFDKQAYLAAATRATYVLENYPQSVATLESLALLEQVYQKLEMPEITQDVQQVIQLNQTRLQPTLEIAKQKQLEHQKKSWWQKTTDFFDGFTR